MSLVKNTKSERTRAAILAAAEEQFARRGYEGTRLDDVAEALHMTGAALFYYFRDKEALYDAMTKQAFGTLAASLAEALTSSTSIAQRIERAVEAWVDAVVSRPALARLLLRHIADAEQHPRQRVYPASDALFRAAWVLFKEGKKSGELKPLHDHPFHSASAIIGSTTFYASAMAHLVPTGDFDPLSPEQVALHKRDALNTARYYLGMRSAGQKAPAPKTRKPASKARPTNNRSK